MRQAACHAPNPLARKKAFFNLKSDIHAGKNGGYTGTYHAYP